MKLFALTTFLSLFSAALCARGDSPTRAHAVDAVMRAHAAEFKQCRENGIAAGRPSVFGKMMTIITVAKNGEVARAGVKSSSLRDPHTQECILTVIRAMTFPKPTAGAYEIVYPFEFRESQS